MSENRFRKPKFQPILIISKENPVPKVEKYILPLNLIWGHLRFVSYMDLKNDFGVSKHK